MLFIKDKVLARTGFILVCLLFCQQKVIAQQLEVFGGYFPNDYFSKESDNPHYSAEHTDGDGFSVGISIDSLIYDAKRFRLTLSFEQYTGGITERDGGLGGGYDLKAKSTKSTIGFRFFLINFNFAKEFFFNFGGAFNILIDEDTEGYEHSYNITGYSNTTDLSDGSINSNVTFGIIGRLGYNLKIKDKWFLVPSYSMYLGLSPEFKDITTRTKSFRQYFELGIAKRF